MKKLNIGVRHRISVSLLLVALGLVPARAAERAVDAAAVVPSAAPQAPAGPATNVVTPPVAPSLGSVAPLSVPALAAPLSAPSRFTSVRPPAPVFGKRKTAPQSQAATAAAAAATGVSPAPSRDAAPSLPASAVAAAGAPRGPPAVSPPGRASAQAATDASAPPLIQRAREEARKLGTSAETDALPRASQASEAAVAAELSRLRTRGWGLLPAGSLVTPSRAANIAAQIDRDWKRQRDGLFNTWELYSVPKGWQRDVGGDAHGRGGARELLEDLTRRLQDALPGESIVMRDAQLRLRYQKIDKDALHVDSGYITATITLKGPGTLLYDFQNGVQEREAPVNAVALVTNEDRERAEKIDGTLHSSPSADRYEPGRDNDERWIIIVRYKREGQDPSTPEERQRFAKRVELKRRAAQAYRDRKNPPPKKKGFSLFGLTLGGAGE